MILGFFYGVCWLEALGLAIIGLYSVRCHEKNVLMIPFGAGVIRVKYMDLIIIKVCLMI